MEDTSDDGWKHRLVEEKKELFERILKLKEFLETSSLEVDSSQRVLMAEQLGVMLDLYSILDARLKLALIS